MCTNVTSPPAVPYHSRRISRPPQRSRPPLRQPDYAVAHILVYISVLLSNKGDYVADAIFVQKQLADNNSNKCCYGTFFLSSSSSFFPCDSFSRKLAPSQPDLNEYYMIHLYP